MVSFSDNESAGVDAAGAFRALLDDAGDPSLHGSELLPTRLASACVRALGVEGAGLSLRSQGFRVPLGASDPTAATAEILQFTTGEGPCLQALRDASEVRATAADMARQWPVFHDELIRRTPYRSIVSVPLRITPLLRGSVDLYMLDPDGALALDLDQATAVVSLMANVLRLDPTPPVESITVSELEVPAWTYSPSTRSRLRVWIAVGVVMAHSEVAAPAALDQLSGYAYSHGQNLNDVTDSMINGTLSPETVVAD